MRIAFLVGHFPRLSETFILNQITGLVDRGHHVDIYTQHIEDWSTVHPNVNRYGLRDCTYCLQEVPQNYLWRIIKGFWLVLTNFHRNPKLIVRSLNVLAYGEQAVALWLLYSAIALIDRASDYDIIHCQFGTLGYQGLAFKQLLKPTPKLILMFRGFDISCYVAQGGDKVYRQLFSRVDYSLVNCDFFRQRVVDLGCDSQKLSVHFSGLDVNKFNFQPRALKPGEQIRIASTGRLVEKKGIEYAIRAVASQARKTPAISYYIVGDGPLKQSLENLIAELNAESYIHLVGWQNEFEIIETLSNCHLFIAPSVTASDGNQDAPINVLKEAMALGLPVISTVHGGIPELVQDGVSGFLVPERDVDALVAKLDYLIMHPERWYEMGKAGRTFVESHFNLEHLNDELVRLYERLIGDSSSAPPTAASRKVETAFASPN
ncbi:MAG: glycosyltransferase [Elainellaceae cyanobacterium]